MLLKYFYDDRLAQASYMVGCPATGTAIIIDPARDIEPYLDSAANHGLRLIGAAETHIHADYASGGRELVHRCGGMLYVSGHGRRENAELAYEIEKDTPVHYLYEGDVIQVGNVTLTTMHTPGHTPEHICFLLHDNKAEHAMGIFSGDCLFVGDMGRPDLLEESLHVANTKEIGARQQFANMQRLKAMPDHLQVWPGHGAGSACGKALGAIPSSTLGYEKLINPAFQFADVDAFVQWLIADQPEAPSYFGQMKAINRVGPTLLKELPTVQKLPTDQLTGLLQGAALVIDTRASDAVAASYMPGTLHIPHTSDRFNTYLGWYVDYAQPVYLITTEALLPRLLKELRAIGVDNVPGWFSSEALPTQTESIGQISVDEAALKAQRGEALIIDVRGASEYAEKHIPGAKSLPMGTILRHLDELPQDMELIIHCGSGVRSMVVASLLRKHGVQSSNLIGGIDAWENARLVVDRL